MQKTYLTLTEASKIVPGRPSVSTIWRWALHGCGGVRLRHRRYGGRLFTRRDWLDEFSHELAERRSREFEKAHRSPRSNGRTLKQRKRDRD